MATKPQESAGDLSRAMSAEIRAEMGSQRVTGQELAGKIGKSQNYLSKRLRDEVSLSVNDTEAIASALRIPYSVFMDRVLGRLRKIYPDEGN